MDGVHHLYIVLEFNKGAIKVKWLPSLSIISLVTQLVRTFLIGGG